MPSLLTKYMQQKVISHKLQEFTTPVCHIRVTFPFDVLELEITSIGKRTTDLKFLLIAYRVTHAPRLSNLHGYSLDSVLQTCLNSAK